MTIGGGVVVLDAVNATEVVLAVRTHRGARLGVQRTAGVVVGDDRGVEVEDVHRAVGTEGDVDRTEPMVHRAEPFGILQDELTLIGGTVEHELLVVNDVEDRLGDEDRTVVFLGPSGVFIDGRRTGGGVATDLVNLEQGSAVREILAEDWATRVHRGERFGGRAGDFSEDAFREDDVLDGVAVRGLTMVEFHVARDFVAEAVATLRGDLLDGGSVGLETERARRKAGHRGTGLRVRRGPAAAVRSVDPTVGGDDEVVGDEVGVTWGEATIKDLFLVGLAVTVGVAQPDDILLGNDDHAVLVDTKTGNQFEAFVEDDLLVEDAVLLRRNQDANLVAGRAVVVTRSQHAPFLPGFRIQGATAVRVFRGFGDPEATAFVPLHGDGLINEGFGREDADLEARLHLELRDGIGTTARAAGRVTDVLEVGLRAEFVSQRTLRGPGGGTGDEGTEAHVVQRAHLGPGQEDSGAVVVGFIRPELRLDVVDRGTVSGLRRLTAFVGDLGGEGRAEDENLLVQREVIDRVVLNIKGRSRDGQRMRVRPDRQQHVVRELLALARPGAAEDRLAKLGVACGHRAVHGDHATATLGEGTEGLLSVGRINGELRLIKHDDVGLSQGLGRGGGRLGDLRPTPGQVGDGTAGRLVIIADDEDAQRGSRNEGSRKQE